MERQTAKEDRHERSPHEILDEGAKQRTFTSAIADDCQRYTTSEVEDDQKRDEDLPGRHVEVVQGIVEPAHDEIVEDSQGQANTDGEV